MNKGILIFSAIMLTISTSLLASSPKNIYSDGDGTIIDHGSGTYEYTRETEKEARERLDQEKKDKGTE